MTPPKHGALAATAAFTLWGILPIFWKALTGVPVLEVTMHRVLWCLLMIIPVVILRGSLQSTLTAFKSPRIVAIHAFSALMLSSNWLLYVWATMHDRILEGALGYYLNPFLYILLGRLFLGERHSRLQLISIGVALVGVALQFPAIEGVPWIAIGLACTFAAYGMVKKQSPLGPFAGLTMETALLSPLALLYGASLLRSGQTAFGTDSLTSLLLIATGAATAIPLLLFARGARSISLSLLGILQFIGPTGQFLIGWLLYHEPLPPLRLASFALIWIAVGVYVFSLRRRKNALEA